MTDSTGPGARLTIGSTVRPGDRQATSRTVDLPAEFLERYRLLDSLGRGAMGEVFHARDNLTGQELAIKFCLTFGSRGAAERLQREGELLARIRHPNVIGVVKSGVIEDIPYLVMPYTPGKSLREFLKVRRALLPVLAVDLVRQVLRALDEAHNRGIVHRDLKPDNILVTEDNRALLLDLGVATSWADGSALADASSVVGTPGYMSPEQCQGLPAGVAADLYAVAVILFELLTGSLPYRSRDPRKLLLAHVHAPIPRASERRQGLDPTWDAIVARGMAKRISDRYPDALAFEQTLAKAIEGRYLPSVVHADLGLEEVKGRHVEAHPAAARAGRSLLAALVVYNVIGLLARDLSVNGLSIYILANVFARERPSRFGEPAWAFPLKLAKAATATALCLFFPFWIIGSTLSPMAFLVCCYLFLWPACLQTLPPGRWKSLPMLWANLFISVSIAWGVFSYGAILGWPGALWLCLQAIAALRAEPLDTRGLPFTTALGLLFVTGASPGDSEEIAPLLSSGGGEPDEVATTLHVLPRVVAGDAAGPGAVTTAAPEPHPRRPR